MMGFFLMWWYGFREMYRLEKPGRYYAIATGAWLSVFLGALLLSQALRGLGHERLGRALGGVVLLALAAYLLWLVLRWARAELRRIDAEVARRMLEARHKAELAERGRRLRMAQEAMATHAAQEEARQLQRQQQALKDAQANAFVYFIVDWQRRVVKIGVSQSPQKRLAALQTSNPHPLDLAAIVPGGFALERELHERYAAYRLNGEWFQLTQEIVDQIESFKTAQHENGENKHG